jgi:hypothetical protein
MTREFIETAYDAGVRSALKDFGITKTSGFLDKLLGRGGRSADKSLDSGKLLKSLDSVDANLNAVAENHLRARSLAVDPQGILSPRDPARLAAKRNFKAQVRPLREAYQTTPPGPEAEKKLEELMEFMRKLDPDRKFY